MLLTCHLPRHCFLLMLDPPAAGTPSPQHLTILYLWSQLLSHFCFPICPSEKLVNNEVSAWGPLVCSICTSASRFSMAWELLCSPSQALRINVWSPIRAECLTFILWKAILYRRETGGLCYPQRVIQGCKFKYQVPRAYAWENGTLPSKQVHKYVPRTLLKYHRFVS